LWPSSDLHGAWDQDKIIGHNAPLYQLPGESEFFRENLNVDACVKYWLANGAPKEKLIVGMPLYGRTFTLTNAANYKPGDKFLGPGSKGKYLGESGVLSYMEFCEQQLTNKWTMEWESNQQVSYGHTTTEWVGIDNEKSIELKAKYVLSNGLGGAMVWSVDMDDFLGICSSTGRKYPLLNALYNTLNGGILPPVTPTAKPTPTVTVTSSPSGNSANCAKLGTFRDPNNCNRFYTCQVINQIVTFQSCGAGLMYDTVYGVCNWPAAVDCRNL
jgi:chitinase